MNQIELSDAEMLTMLQAQRVVIFNALWKRCDGMCLDKPEERIAVTRVILEALYEPEEVERLDWTAWSPNRREEVHECPTCGTAWPGGLNLS